MRYYPLTLFFALCALVAPSLQVPSNVPTVCFVCPVVDLAGRPLLVHNVDGGQLFCRYQSNPNDWFCKYFTNTGLLKQDHDDGSCPPVAITQLCSQERKRSVLPRSPHAPQPGARSVPSVMHRRAYLGKKRHHEEDM